MPQISNYRYVPLPVELLIHIFSIALDAYWFDKTHPVLALASVCAFWHSVAIGTPSFWQKIKIPPSSFDFIKLQLDHSHQHPLIVDVYSETSLDGSLLALLVEHSEQWEEVALTIPEPDYSFLTSVRGRLPRLKRLKIDTYYLSEAPDFDGFEKAPLLREVIFEPLRDRFSSGFPIPYSQLTKLQCIGCPVRLLYPILTRVPTLVKLEVIAVDYDRFEISSPALAFPNLQKATVMECEAPFFYCLLAHTPLLTELWIYGFAGSGRLDLAATLTLPLLRSLVIEVAGFDRYLATVICSLRAPNLVELDFRGDLEDNEEEDNGLYLRHIQHFVQNSGCRLQSVRILLKAGDPGTSLAMLSLLGAMPSLDHLVIAIDYLEHIPFSSLTPVSSVLPNLSTFIIYTAEFDDLAVLNDLVTFAQRRGELKMQILTSGELRK
ncbi:hypothetical protein GYMLUDRAFT_245635 [Collybiopsis luxurians FD-317 M1]|uniref:F-box domain-containing protein n=1 Tax=Collybiopsis luxurians FD-317 M1 TaxID=944289 RepID=A0A0D0B631_9AGAR|nr:hypothetical protein GYMLUDRAFT_245635 [Collybiopsis luxurians FD-317 M1]